MNYTENYRGIKIDVQSPHIDISEALQVEIRSSIDKLSRFAKDINAMDLYFKSEGQNGNTNNTVGVRLGIPGPDVFAEENGDNLITSLKSVVNKLIRQLEKK
jgi:putative sigma-54 modulation protein